jgi:acyl-CoA thioester hydrolase
MEEFGHVAELDVRFRDLDTMGHVNNALYITYLEQARAEYFSDVIDVPLADAEIVLARLAVEYEAPIDLNESVTVYSRVPTVSESSFPMEHAIRADGTLAATADSVIVPFDLDAGIARTVPPSWRNHICHHEDMDAN